VTQYAAFISLYQTLIICLYSEVVIICSSFIFARRSLYWLWQAVSALCGNDICGIDTCDVRFIRFKHVRQPRYRRGKRALLGANIVRKPHGLR